MEPAEVRSVLAILEREVTVDLSALWRAAEGRSSDEFRRYVIDAFPEVVLPYSAIAADVGVEMYETAPTTSDGFVAVEGELPPAERLTESATWALNVGAAESALTLMTGSATRAVFDGLRDTVLTNVDREPGARWVRHASANACGFCKMLATRHVGQNATFYSSEDAAGGVVGRGREMSEADRRDRAAGRTRRSGSGQQGQFLAAGQRTRGNQSIGDKYHDNCHCIPIAVRPGSSYTPPPYVQQWNDEYIAATKKAAAEGLTRGGAIDPNVIARLMDSH